MDKKTTFSLLSIIRKHKKVKSGEIPIYLRITVDKQRIEISTKMAVPVGASWQPGLGKVRGTSDDIKRVNSGIISFEHRAREIYNRFIEHGKIVSANSIKNELTARLPLSLNQCFLIDCLKAVKTFCDLNINAAVLFNCCTTWKNQFLFLILVNNMSIWRPTISS